MNKEIYHYLLYTGLDYFTASRWRAYKFFRKLSVRVAGGEAVFGVDAVAVFPRGWVSLVS